MSALAASPAGRLLQDVRKDDQVSIRHPGLKCGKKIACTEERLRELHTEHLAGRSLASIGKEVGLTAQGVWAAFNSRDWELTGGRRLGWERREVRSG